MTSTIPPLNIGTIQSLNTDNGFGYILDEQKDKSYMFILGKAIKHRDIRALAVHKKVQYVLNDHGKIAGVVAI